MSHRIVERTDTFTIIECPHCQGIVQVNHSDINCQIFRHAVYKHNQQPIHPHMSKQACDLLHQTGRIYGCGRPFRFDGREVHPCDYV